MRSKNTFSISFFVKKHRISREKVPVYARITVNGKSRDISLKRKVPVDRWDNDRGTAKGSRDEIKALSAYLEQVRNHLYECVQELEKERKLLTAEAVKNTARIFFSVLWKPATLRVLFLLRAVKHPVDAKLIDTTAEIISPEHILQFHGHLPTFRKCFFGVPFKYYFS